MAAVPARRQLYLVDASGDVIDEFGPQYAEFDLPIVDGLVARAEAAASRRSIRRAPSSRRG